MERVCLSWSLGTCKQNELKMGFCDEISYLRRKGAIMSYVEYIWPFSHSSCLCLVMSWHVMCR